MARTTPPGIDPVPTPPIQRGDRATFSSRVDAFILWLVNAVTQFQATATNVYNNAVDAFQSATGAATSATNASTSATNAGNSATAAGNSATAAAGSATAAGNSATAAATSASNAASSATGLTATSTSSNTLGTGSKTFTVQSGKQFVAGIRVSAVNPSTPIQFMSGTVTSYSGTSLVVAVDAFEGTGTVANWNISVTGQRGVQGPTGIAPAARLRTVVLTSSGMFTVPATDFEVEVQAGGNAGQGGTSGSTATGGALGGSAGWCGVKSVQGATVGATAVVNVGQGVTGTNGIPAQTGGESSFSLSGVATVTATTTAVTGADITYPGQRGIRGVYDPTGGVSSSQGGSSKNGFGGYLLSSEGINGNPGVGFGSGGSGASNVAGSGMPGVVIIRYVG